MKKRISITFGIIILVIFAIATASVLSWYVGSHKTSATSNQAADWKTYTNALYGYEFQYPSYLTVDVSNPKYVNIDSQNSTYLFASNIQVDESTTDMNGNPITLQSYAAWYGSLGKNKQVQKIMVDGLPAYEITQDNSDSTNTTDVIVVKDNKTYILHLLNEGFHAIKYQTKDFSTILSTFTFTNQTASSQTAGSNGSVEKTFSYGSYQVLKHNTEVDPCLTLQVLGKNGGVASSHTLCNVQLDGKVFMLTPSSIQDIQYANISWTAAGLFFDLSLLKALPDSPMDIYHCQVLNFDNPTVSCNLTQQQ
jgi:hypothetical protein